MKIRINNYCRIFSNRILLTRNVHFESAQEPADMNHFLTEIYNWREIDYRKFFKMDALSKAGFLASELLLEDFDREQPKKNMGIILFNQSSSLEADKAYQQTISDPENYFPSPAVFVYTLPNIVTGEIAIRNKIYGETAFYISSRFQAGLIEEIATGVVYDYGLKYLLTGWVEIDKDEIDTFLMLCEVGAQGQMAFNAKNIEKLYNKSLKYNK